MGFNPWSRYQCSPDETLFLTTATTMLSTGLLTAGYTRLNLDDCWTTHERAPNGSLQWDSGKFPHGIPWLAEFVKSQGIELGIYADAGNATCGGFPGSEGWEEVDAGVFGEWGVGYVKVDGCNLFASEEVGTLEEVYRRVYGRWSEVLRGDVDPDPDSTEGRRSRSKKKEKKKEKGMMIFSQSAPAYFFNSSPNHTTWYTILEWVRQTGELARHSTDILVYADQDQSSPSKAWTSIMHNYHTNTLLARYQAPGFYNDPDFLIPDHPGLTLAEKRTQFTLWASFSAPLIISADLPALVGTEEMQFLLNSEVIAVDQDVLAQQATLASRDAEVDVLTRSLVDGRRVVTVLNRGADRVRRAIPLEWLGLHLGCKFRVRDLWTGVEQGDVRGVLVVEVASHATEMYTLMPEGDEHGDCPVESTGIVLHAASEGCLTGGSAISGVKIETCRATADQIWQVSRLGELRPLAASGLCLTGEAGKASLRRCSGGEDQRWSYAISGNLQNEFTGSCLTESEGESEMKPCVRAADSQVFALPAATAVDQSTD
ncbi:hypothetical protein FE257_003083 [Aspergillus nanangensis]|uniref:Alpha-galactosidase n=1 Tax=Aspergillus nanangensis TaxID=2582783 RepID=A0AAD4GN05_ASPNN|nr:hypothetical protein FE257_003083 [Aspergillus nanangensis]